MQCAVWARPELSSNTTSAIARKVTEGADTTRASEPEPSLAPLTPEEEEDIQGDAERQPGVFDPFANAMGSSAGKRLLVSSCMLHIPHLREVPLFYHSIIITDGDCFRRALLPLR